MSKIDYILHNNYTDISLVVADQNISLAAAFWTRCSRMTNFGKLET